MNKRKHEPPPSQVVDSEFFASIRHGVESALLNSGIKRILVAVSGGSDSVALLLALHRLCSPRDIVLQVAHIVHGLRPEAGQLDASFVRHLAASLNLPCHVTEVDTPGEMKRTGDSLEMAARRLRLAALEATANTMQADAICLGHTRDDQIETLFIRLARGAGSTGLGGIAPRGQTRSGVTLLRPLLDIRRETLQGWLRSENAQWREDESNSDTNIMRNRVRSQVVPAFVECFGPAAVDSAIRSMELQREEEADWLRPLVGEALTEAYAAHPPTALSSESIAALPRPLAKRVLLAWLHEHQLDPQHQSQALLERLLEFALATVRDPPDATGRKCNRSARVRPADFRKRWGGIRSNPARCGTVRTLPHDFTRLETRNQHRAQPWRDQAAAIPPTDAAT